MDEIEIEKLRAAMSALQAQRENLGDAVLELAIAPLRARLASLHRSAGLQRRQVTVLFADVVGSTAMASGLDAEDTLDVLSGALQRMAAEVEAHQGRVLRFTGDGVKAAFGMDEAREDDPERAVRAGLAILAVGREQAKVARLKHGLADFGVRVGVHTGVVVLGAGVEDDNTAMGAAVNIAARMEQSAPPGALRISHDTWIHVRGLFDADQQLPLQVKGVEAPMQTYLVRAALDRSVAAVERGLQGLKTPLIGRQAQLQQLLDAISRAREANQLQAMTLLSDAGMGKSRLLRELKAVLSDGTPGCQVLTVRSHPDGMLHPWGLLRSLLAAQFALTDNDSADVALRKVLDGLSPWFAERGEQQAQLIGQLSGLDYGDSPHLRGLDPRALRDQALAALLVYLQALAAPGGAVLLVEDLHWADEGSLDLMQHLMSKAAGLPMALIMTARPTLLARRPEWGAPGAVLRLAALDATQGEQLANALLQRMDPVPPALSELLVGQAEGNPYYMEELVRRLVDDGVIAVEGLQWRLRTDLLDKVRLPGTLVGLLQARLDALPADERRAARQASVIGHVFWDDALKALDEHAPMALPALERAAFVRAHVKSGIEGSAERQFDHHLLHEVTYDTLLKTERRFGHAAAARWLAERTQGRGAEFLAMTGQHAERAGEIAMAIDCFEKAGMEARKRFANAAAMAWLRRAVALLGETEPTRRLDLLSQLSDLADTVGDRAAQAAAHDEIAVLLERHPDDQRHARLLFSRALLADRRGDTATSEPLARRAYELAELSGAPRWAAMARGQLGWLQFTRNDHAGALDHIEEGLKAAARMDADQGRAEVESQLLLVSAMVLTRMDRLAEASANFQAVLERGEARGLARLQLGALDGLVAIASTLEHWDEVTRHAQRMLALAESIGAVPRTAHALCHLALAAEARGDVDEAIRLNQRVLPTVRANGNRLVEVEALQRLGACHRLLHDPLGALAWHEQAHAMYLAMDDTVGACEAEGAIALCASDLGRPEQAVITVDHLLALLAGDLADRPYHQTIEVRWCCRQVLDSLHDERATPMLEQLHADVQRRASELTHAADRDRLIQASALFGAIVRSHQARSKLG